MRPPRPRRRCRCLAPLLLGAPLAMISHDAAASTFRHDVDPQAYVDYGDVMKGVGGVTFSPDALSPPTAFGSGVLIHPEWVLTAAHVVGEATTNSLVRFEMDPDPADTDELPLSGFFFVTAIAIHEHYDDDLGPAGGFDLALLRLERPVTYLAPWQRVAGSAATNPELDRPGTAVGFGATGDGRTGYDPLSGGFFRLAVDSMVDAVATDPRILEEFFERDVVDPKTGLPVHLTREQIASQFVLSDFDDPASIPDDPATPDIDESYVNDGLNPLGSADALPLEGSVAPGDSGGPMLIDQDGTLRVAGVNSFIHGFDAPFGDGTDNATYSDLAGFLRVSMFNDWIDEQIGVPEPSTGLLLVAAACGLALGRPRRRR